MVAFTRSTRCSKRSSRRADDRIVFLGDLIDQGKESREVLERIIELQRRVRRWC